MMTARKPTTDEERMATIGTPRELTDTIDAGASRRAARTNNIRDAVYRPELRQERTAVSTTAFITWSAYGMPISWNAATYGEASRVDEFQGRITVSRKIEPTKKVAISAPTIEKMTVTTPAVTARPPLGKKPPCAVRLLKSRSAFGQMPRTKRPPQTRKTMIAATLIPANQNSNSPNDETEMRLVPVMRSMSTRLSTQVGTPGSQKLMTLAPATASKPTTMTQKYQ